MNATESMVDLFNGFLRGELAAVETYQQGLEKMQNKKGAVELKRIHDEHRDAANTIRQHIREMGGTPEQGSGTWGAFAKTTEGTAKVFGDSAALQALKKGEESGVSDYEKALNNNALQPECRSLINQLVAQTRAHISGLDRLIAAK